MSGSEEIQINILASTNLFQFLFIYLFKILKTIQSRTPYKRGAEVKRIPCIQNLFTKSTKE